MKCWLVVVQWMVLATATAAPAKAPKSLPAGNRFLFVLETSAAMSRLEHGGRQAIFDLIHSGVDQRMRNGDSYGIWTFDEHVSAGVYPMQIWDGQRSLEHAAKAGQFLRMRNYDREGHMPNLMKQLQAVLRVAKDLNVFIITDGNAPVQGTPFDDEINAGHRASVVKMVHTAKPLITTLTARNGQFTSASVTLAGEEIAQAQLPPRQSETAGLVTGSNAPATNAVAAAAPKKPIGQIVAIADVDELATRGAANAGQPPPKQRPSAIIITSSGVEVKTNAASDANAVAGVSVPPAVASGVATPPATPSNAVATPGEVPAEIVSAPVLATPAPVVSAPVPATPATVASGVATPPAAVVSAPAVATNPPPPKPEPLPAFVPAQIKVAAKSPAASERVMAALWSGNMMLVFGGVFVGASLLGGLIFVRRMRRTGHTSFISQGMDRS